MPEKRLETLGEANRVLYALQKKIDESIASLEPYSLPGVKATLKAVRAEISWTRSMIVVRRNVLRAAAH